MGEAGKGIRKIVFGESNQTVAIVDSQGVATLWDTVRRNAKAIDRVDFNVVAFSREGAILWGGADNILYQIDLMTFKEQCWVLPPLRSFDPSFMINQILPLADGRLLFSTYTIYNGDGRGDTVWQLVGGDLKKIYAGPSHETQYCSTTRHTQLLEKHVLDIGWTKWGPSVVLFDPAQSQTLVLRNRLPLTKWRFVLLPQFWVATLLLLATAWSWRQDKRLLSTVP
jgi:hypothetical protein